MPRASKGSSDQRFSLSSQVLEILRRVEIREQPLRRAEDGDIRGAHLRHRQHLAEGARAQAAGVNGRSDGWLRCPRIDGKQRFRPAAGPHPRAIVSLGQFDQPGQQSGIEKRQVAGDDDDTIRVGDVESRVNAADGADVRNPIGVHRESDIVEAVRRPADGKNRRRNSAQHLDLPYDDRAALDDEPALVLPAITAGVAAGNDRRGRREEGHAPIMTEARIGRLLAACLHQAILEQLPQRMDFYEHWLHSDGLRDGNIGLAPITAVVGFLRTEGDAYDRIMAQAGRLAAEWSVTSMSAIRKRTLLWLPRGLRTRAALRVAAEIGRDICSTTRTLASVKGSSARVEVRESLFCAVRGQQATPLCGFYVAVAIETLRQLGLTAAGRIDRCRAIDGGNCIMTFEITGVAETTTEPAIAA